MKDLRSVRTSRDLPRVTIKEGGLERALKTLGRLAAAQLSAVKNRRYFKKKREKRAKRESG